MSCRKLDCKRCSAVCDFSIEILLYRLFGNFVAQLSPNGEPLKTRLYTPNCSNVVIQKGNNEIKKTI